METPFTTFTVDSVTGNKTTFFLSVLSCKKSDRLNQIYTELEGKQFSSPEVQQGVREAITLGVIGWDRDEPFTPEAVSGVMSRAELVDFVGAGGYPLAISLEESKRWKERREKGIPFLILKDDKADAPVTAG